MIRILWLCAAALLWISCDDTVYIGFVADPSVDSSIIEKIQTSPLPEGFAFAGEPGAAETPSPSIIVKKTDWTSPRIERQTASHIAHKVLERNWYVPTVSFSSPFFDAADLGEDASYALEPLESVTLPRRGLAVSGQYPGEEGYPYYKETSAYLFGDGDESVDEEVIRKLAGWIDSLPAETDEPQFFWFGAVGDIMPGRGVSELLATANGLDAVFSDTLPYLKKVDLLAGNLEGAVTTRGVRANKSYTFRFTPPVLSHLREAGFGYLSITNNHSYDFGEIGFLDTLDALRSASIETSGAGADPEQAGLPSVFASESGEVRVLSIGAYPDERNGFSGVAHASVQDSRPGILWADAEGLRAVRAAFSEDSFDVLMVHGGREWSTAPTDEQRELYRRFVDLGADAVIGSHPHYLHGIEVYSGRLIAHSLGNFIFPGMQETAFGEESMILMLGIHDGHIRYVRMVPVNIDVKRLSVDTSGRILSRVLALTQGLEQN